MNLVALSDIRLISDTEDVDAGLVDTLTADGLFLAEWAELASTFEWPAKI